MLGASIGPLGALQLGQIFGVVEPPDVEVDPTVVFCVPEDRRVFGVRCEDRTFDAKLDDRTIWVKRQRGCSDA